MKYFKPPRDEPLPSKLALWAAIADLHDLLAVLETVDDEATRKVIRAWLAKSRLKELWRIE